MTKARKLKFWANSVLRNHGEIGGIGVMGGTEGMGGIGGMELDLFLKKYIS